MPAPHRLRTRALVPALLALFALLVPGAGISGSQGTPPVPPPPLKLPQASPAARVTLDVGPATVDIVYHRPALRGRDVWKELAAAGPVWRLGANEATTIELSEAATIAGQTLPAGRYALFARVEKEKWTLLFNKNPQQWGAYFHDDKLDCLRVEVAPRTVAKREWFRIALDPKDDDSATVTIGWDTTEVSFDLDFAVDALVERDIERALARLAKDDWDTRLQIVKHWAGRGERLADALRLAEEAVAIEANFWTLEWNARLLHQLGDTEPAIPLLERAIEAAKKGPPREYRDGLIRLLAEWQGEAP